MGLFVARTISNELRCLLLVSGSAAFMAALGANGGTSGQTVIFDRVIVNRGDNYNANTGKSNHSCESLSERRILCLCV